MFGKVLNRKLAFLDNKNMDQKNSRKTGNFPKGLVHCFGQNYEISLFLVFRQHKPKNVFRNVLDRKVAFLHYKNMDLKKSQNSHFSKGVSPWFWPKL